MGPPRGVFKIRGVPIRRATQKSDSSRFRVSGFGCRVSGFDRSMGKVSLQSRFRVSGFGFRVSGFGFRRLKPTFAVGFGFRVSGFDRSCKVFRVGFGFRISQFETNFNSRFRVSGFGFRWSKPTLQTSLRITSRLGGWHGNVKRISRELGNRKKWDGKHKGCAYLWKHNVSCSLESVGI